MDRRGLVGLSAVLAGPALAANPTHCPVTYQQLEHALRDSVHASGGPTNGGLPVNEWAAVVNRAGQVCAVARSGAKATDQWRGSRAIAVEKADTANSFDLNNYAISTAELWAASQPGGYLYGANTSNPPVAVDLYAGPISRWGTATDPLVGETVGGPSISREASDYMTRPAWWEDSARAATHPAPIRTSPGGSARSST